MAKAIKATKALTGHELKALRESMELSTGQFGQLFGLSTSAVNRWEQKKGKVIRMDPFASKVLDALLKGIKKLGKGKFGQLVSKALEHEHDLFPLWKVLGTIFGGKDGNILTREKRSAKSAKVKTAKPAKKAATTKPRVAKKAKTARATLSDGAKANLAVGSAKIRKAKAKSAVKAERAPETTSAPSIPAPVVEAPSADAAPPTPVS